MKLWGGKIRIADTAVIIAGGEGKRLRPLTNDIPKPMIRINNKPAEKHTDFMKDIFSKMLGDSKKLYAYKTNEYIKDMGTMSRLNKVTNDLLEGKIVCLL